MSFWCLHLSVLFFIALIQGVLEEAHPGPFPSNGTAHMQGALVPQGEGWEPRAVHRGLRRGPAQGAGAWRAQRRLRVGRRGL